MNSSPDRDDSTTSPRSGVPAVTPDTIPIADYPSLNGLHVLAVDDELDSRNMIMYALQMHGAEVTTANSAERALEILSQEKIDLLVSDISMPHHDGYYLMRKVRSRYKIPGLALTAFEDRKSIEESRAAGFQQHITKPISAAFLIAAVADLAETATNKNKAKEKNAFN